MFIYGVTFTVDVGNDGSVPEMKCKDVSKLMDSASLDKNHYSLE